MLRLELLEPLELLDQRRRRRLRLRLVVRRRDGRMLRLLAGRRCWVEKVGQRLELLCWVGRLDQRLALLRSEFDSVHRVGQRQGLQSSFLGFGSELGWRWQVGQRPERQSRTACQRHCCWQLPATTERRTRCCLGWLVARMMKVLKVRRMQIAVAGRRQAVRSWVHQKRACLLRQRLRVPWEVVGRIFHHCLWRRCCPWSARRSFARKCHCGWGEHCRRRR